MKTIDHLVFAEPDCTTEVHVGTFFFDDPLTNEPTRAEFFVRTCAAEPQNTEFGEDFTAVLRRDKRQDDYNEQYGHQFEALERRGCKNVRFQAVYPHPII